MRLVKIFFLCLLIVVNSFAASASPRIGESIPTNINSYVYDSDHSRDMESEFSALRALGWLYSIAAIPAGIALAVLGASALSDGDNLCAVDAKWGLIGGIGVTALGVTGIVLLSW